MAEKDSRRRNSKPKREQSEYAQQIVDIARVTRVMAGGKRMRFRVCLVIGDKKGKVGIGLGKAKDVPLAVQKAYKQAEKNLLKVNMIDGTIPHEVRIKRGASKIILKPAPEGTGVIAGGACRIVLELAGVRNVVSKILGTNNKINNVKTTIEALSLLKFRKKDKMSKMEKGEKIENVEIKQNSKIEN